MESDTTGGTTTTTLYLPGEQLSSNGTTITGVRYYSFAGHVIGETTAAGRPPSRSRSGAAPAA